MNAVASMNSGKLWEIAACCFSTDDGSLPSIEVQGLTSDELAGIFSTITQRGDLASRDVVVREVDSGNELKFSDVPNPAKLVAEYKVEPFHAVFANISSHDCVLPDIGFFFFQDLVAIDYRMGSHWNAKTLYAFLEFLSNLIEDTSSGVLTPSPSDGPADPEAFMLAWREFLSCSAE